MRTLNNTITVLLILAFIAYVVQAQRAVEITKRHLKWALEEKKITEEQYKGQLADATLQKIILNPAVVFDLN